LAVALLAGVVLLGLAIVVLPLHSINGEYVDSIGDLRFRLDKYRKIVAEKDAWAARLEEIRQRGEQEERFIAKNTAALASAELQTRIKQAVVDAGGELISTQVIPERKEEQFSRIAVRVRMTCGTQALRDVLYSFESGTPSLFVENLNIRPIRIAQPMGPGGKPAIPADRLSVDFEVVGYMRGTD
jgi:general secretion pathway protein M